MAKSLEDTLRDLAKRGELSYLSIAPVVGGFEATFSPASRFGHSFGSDIDPVKAALSAVENFGPVGRKRTPKSPPEVDPEVEALLS